MNVNLLCVQCVVCNMIIYGEYKYLINELKNKNYIVIIVQYIGQKVVRAHSKT